ncbi:hypothetical protein K439DRAFT_1621035 [Ramaria rubella]|nr:hypothetical protein K439DRAFT_1621035 [Ramaria rubella]
MTQLSRSDISPAITNQPDPPHLDGVTSSTLPCDTTTHPWLDLPSPSPNPPTDSLCVTHTAASGLPDSYPPSAPPSAPIVSSNFPQPLFPDLPLSKHHSLDIPHVPPPQPMDKKARACKTSAEFTYTDIDKLLNVVLHVNLFMSKHTQNKEKWQEVLRVVQENGGCLGRDWETVHNKLKTVLKSVGKPNAKSAFPRSMLGQELESVPQLLSDWIDAIAAMKKHAEQVLDEEHDQVKEAQDTKAVHGHAICNAMLTGHAHWSKRTLEDLSESEDLDKENMPHTSMPSSSANTLANSKPQISAKHHRVEGFNWLASLFKPSINRQDEIQMHQSIVSDVLIEEHFQANEEAHLGCEEVGAMRDELHLSREAQERNNLALIDILRQGLL